MTTYNYAIFDNDTGDCIREGELVCHNAIVPPVTPLDKDCRVVIWYKAEMSMLVRELERANELTREEHKAAMLAIIADAADDYRNHRG